ncbi:AmmeMemoRadiSam system protein B [Leisingera sp. JC11]|uniref:AmmeMemoRadiSam system protein B n=1 Tax=Leisingera sp. JC11 TaxID=3042469 RepID=UPI003452D7F8
MSERSCRFAGTFFTADGDQLSAEVGAFLEAAEQTGQAGEAAARAIVAPHAGYRFSGSLAGLSYGAVTWSPKRIVVLGPSHRHWFHGLAFPSQDRFSTPLGVLAIDRPACEELAVAGLAHDEDAAHDNEHAIETQLPFIRTLWPDAQIVPLVCGDAPAGQAAAAIDALAGPETLFVISSDLSHFLSRSAARERDAETARLLENGLAEELTPYRACGAKCLQGWLLSHAGQGTKALRLGMGDSASETGDTSSVVGYGAWAFYPMDAAMLSGKSRAELLDVARGAISRRLETQHEAEALPDAASAPLQTFAASFVTLTCGGELRGCVGTLEARRSLAEDVAENALGAGFRDPRFSPVTAGELRKIRIEITVLSRAQEIEFSSEEEAISRIDPGRDGLILSVGRHRATFLPKVWEGLREPHAFVEGLKRKAGLPRDYWAGNISLHRFRVENFAETLAGS